MPGTEGHWRTSRNASKLSKKTYRMRGNNESESHPIDYDLDNSSVIPTAHRSRLYKLFGLIEKEFETIFAHNIALQAKVEALTERLAEVGSLPPEGAAEILGITTGDVVGSKHRRALQMGQKIKTALRVPPGRLASTFKVGGDPSRFMVVRTFDGHRDGVWHVSSSSGPRPVLGSASADQTARIWSLETGACLLQYLGHTGSVNSISFHGDSVDDLNVVTASGDQSAHIWKASISLASNTTMPNSEEDFESDKDDNEDTDHLSSIRQPLLRLTGHNGVVIAADWFNGGDQLITASWDRTANIYDAEKGEILNILSELNHCCAHASQKLVVTSSKDSTFRLWDFREPIHSVAVFQGHNDSVTSAVFSSGDKVVSGSDDRTVKVWDLRNMRSALTTLRLDSAANRLSVSKLHNLIAIPHDNRQILLYDLLGVRLARLPRSNQRYHRRMVCCTVWADDNPVSNLISCGFDKQIIGWKIATTGFARD